MSKAKFIDQLQISLKIIHGIVFNLMVKLHLIFKDNIFGKNETSLDLCNFKSTCRSFWFKKLLLGERGGYGPPPPSPQYPSILKKIVTACRLKAFCNKAVLKSFKKLTLKHLRISNIFSLKLQT